MTAKKVRVLIGSAFHSEKMSRLNACLNDDIEICAVLAHRQHVGSMREEFPAPVWLYDELVKPELITGTAPSADQYEGCLKWLIADPRTIYLAERYYGVLHYDSVFNHTVQIEIACWNSLTILTDAAPDRIVYMGMVHSLIKWIFARCAEYLGIPTYFTLRSPLPWRYWAVKGIDDRTIVKVCDDDEISMSPPPLSDNTVEYLNKISSTYDVGVPSYMMKHVWSWRAEFKKALSRKPTVLWDRIMHLYRKRQVLERYNQLTRGVNFDETYVVFLLHYQPEATTLPSGYRYVQQWLAVRALATKLPDKWTLYVKEHPSMFAKKYTEKARDTTFYECVAALPRVKLAPLTEDPFKLIDNSVAVATLTGTAGFEAVCRNKPVLAFGAACYKECPGVFPVDSLAGVERALDLISNEKELPTKEKLYRYLAWVEDHSIEGTGSGGVDDKKAEKQSKEIVWQKLVGSKELNRARTYEEWKSH